MGLILNIIREAHKMKRFLAVAVFLLLVFASISANTQRIVDEKKMSIVEKEAERKHFRTEVKVVDKDSIVRARSNTEYVSGYFSASDYITPDFNKMPLPCSIEVKVTNAFFLKEKESSTASMIFDGRDLDQKIELITSGCNVMNTVVWQPHNNYSRYTSTVTIVGNESSSKTESLTLQDTLDLYRNVGIEVSLPTIGKVSSEEQIYVTFQDITQQTVFYTIHRDFTRIIPIDIDVMGMGEFLVSEN